MKKMQRLSDIRVDPNLIKELDAVKKLLNEQLNEREKIQAEAMRVYTKHREGSPEIKKIDAQWRAHDRLMAPTFARHEKLWNAMGRENQRVQEEREAWKRTMGRNLTKIINADTDGRFDSFVDALYA